MIQQQFAIPGNINIPEILNSIGTYNDRYINDHQDKYNYIIHKVVEGQIFNKASNDNGYTILTVSELQKCLGGKYANQILHELLEWGILERDEYYIIGSKSYGYRIAPIHKSKLVLRNVFKEEIWLPKLAKQHAAYKKGIAYKHKLEWKYLTQFGIDSKAAIAFAEAKYAYSQYLLATFETELTAITSSKEGEAYRAILKGIKANYQGRYQLHNDNSYNVHSLMNTASLKKMFSKKGNQGLSALAILSESILDTYNSDVMSIQKIANGDSPNGYFLEQPNPESRIYTNLTNLSKAYKPFLFHKKSSSKLVNLDIRNSQPYLFSLLLMNEWKAKEIPADVANYIQLTASGEFYEYMMELLKLEAKAKLELEGRTEPDADEKELDEDDRREFKIDFFGKIFFCSSKYSRITTEGKIFKKHFPNVYELISYYKEVAYKKLGYTDLNEKTAYKCLALEMQKQEATVILKTIGGQLKKKKIFYATIHDSLIVLQEHQEEVKALILEAFMKVVGVAPTVKPEPMN